MIYIGGNCFGVPMRGGDFYVSDFTKDVWSYTGTEAHEKRIGHLNDGFNYSPLEKFIGRRKTVQEVLADSMARFRLRAVKEWTTGDAAYAPVGTSIPVGAVWHNITTGTIHKWTGSGWVFSHMYGIDFDHTPTPEPEKSPIDKAIDDMMAKRKARREMPEPAEPVAPYSGTPQEVSDAINIHRAMSRLAPHETKFAERILNYRFNSLPALSNG